MRVNAQVICLTCVRKYALDYWEYNDIGIQAVYYHRIDYIYNHYLCEVDVPLRLHYCTVSWMVLWIDICMYISIAERDGIVVWNFGSLFSDRNWLCHDPLKFYSFCFSFHLEVTWSLHVFHLFFRGKQRQPRKPLLYYLVFKENCFVKIFLSCF